MKMPTAKLMLATSTALAALFSIHAASAQSYRAISKPYAGPESYSASRSYDSIHDRPRDPRFTEKEQRIIDRITRANERNGK
jgi:hypothetical protein